MDYRVFSITSCVALLFTLAMLTTLSIVDAQVMQSTNYRIQSDSINVGGGLSTSTSYSLESTGGEIATGESDSSSYKLKAGYQQMVTSYISMSAASPVTMSPTIPGVGGGTSNGSTTVTVTTDSSAGYELSISASQSPAMTSGANTIADYIPGAAPTYSFATGVADSHFGYSPSGIDTVQRFKDDNTSLCNTGSFENALTCWDGLDTVLEPISRSSSANTPSGATTTVYFRVGIGGSVVQIAGTYVATTTLTAIAR